MTRLKTPSENPREFGIGEKVRIYLGYLTDTEIHIREGTVLGHKQDRHWRGCNPSSGFTGDALELMVEKTGLLERTNPRKVGILHRATGYFVLGQVKTEETMKPYKGQYFYACISGAERI
jgi:hypothetical protein